MRIMGFDPGLAIIGYGVIEVDGGRIAAVDYGVINTPKDESTPVRLAMIDSCAKKLIEKFKPDEVALEELFFFRNVTTAMNVAQARGVLIVAAINNCGRIFEYTPLQVKIAVTGYGRAEKAQMQQMVKLLLRLENIPKPDDAADALAVAITHARSRALNARVLQ